MRRALLSLALLGLSPAAWSATDLLVALQAARQHDPAYLAEVAAAQAGSLKAQEGKALWRPTVAVQAGAGYADSYSETTGAKFSAPTMGSADNARFVTDAGQATDLRWGVMLTQPLYNAERSAGAQQLAQQSRIAELQRAQSEQSLRLRVAQRYFEVLLAEDALATVQAQQRAVQASLDIAKENFRLGKSASTDMHEAQASFDAVSAQAVALQSDLDLKRALFTDLTGLSAQGLAPLAPEASLAPLKQGEMATQIEHGVADNLQVKMSEAGREIASQEVDKTRAWNATTLDLVARYDQQRLSGSNAAGDAGYRAHGGWIGLQLTVPLYTGGMRSAKHDEAVLLADKAKWDVSTARQLGAQHIRSAWLGMHSGLEQVRAYQQGVTSAQLRLDATQTGRELGARTTADVLNAQQAYYGAHSNLVRARYQVLLSSLQMAAASGQLSDEKLGEVNALLAH